MADRLCRECGTAVNTKAARCPSCGAMDPGRAPESEQPADRQAPPSTEARSSHEAPTKFCFACGDSIDARAEICPHCGVRQPDQAEDGPNRIAAGLFAIILGGLGAHKFYLGKPLLGVLYLFFVWTFIPSLVGIIEGLFYLSQSDREFRTRYG